MSDKCTFDKAWIGKCNQPAVERGMCADHAPLKCVSCQQPATRECPHTGIQFVCGCWLCDDCEHSAPVQGEANYFALGGGHKPRPEAEAAWAEYRRRIEIQYAEAEVAAAQKRLDETNAKYGVSP